MVDHQSSRAAARVCGIRTGGAGRARSSGATAPALPTPVLTVVVGEVTVARRGREGDAELPQDHPPICVKAAGADNDRHAVPTRIDALVDTAVQSRPGRQSCCNKPIPGTNNGGQPA